MAKYKEIDRDRPIYKKRRKNCFSLIQHQFLIPLTPRFFPLEKSLFVCVCERERGTERGTEREREREREDFGLVVLFLFWRCIVLQGQDKKTHCKTLRLTFVF